MLKIILLISCFLVTNGCSNNGVPIIEEIKAELAIANKNLRSDEVKTIKIKNSLEEGELIIFTQPYIEKEAFAKIISDKELAKKIWRKTVSREGMHLYIINGTQIKADEMLRGIDIDGIFHSRNKNIVLKLKKLDRAHRPLIITGIE